MNVEINRELAVKVLEIVDQGLVKGTGKPTPGAMCVEAAVCFAMGLPHSDEPTCVDLVLRKLKIALNDEAWSSNAARAKGLRRLAIVQLGSAGHLDQKEFARRLADNAIRKQVPTALRAAAHMQKTEERRAALMAAADRCEKEGTRDSALAAKKAADAADDAASAAYAYAAAAYAYAAAAADDADDAAVFAAAAAAYADAAYAAARAQKRDEVLAAFAEDVVQILVDMKAPGCEWLDLAPVEQAA